MTGTRVLHVAAVDFTVSKLLGPQLSHLAELGYEVRVACSRSDAGSWRSLAAFDPVDIGFPRKLRPDLMLTSLRRLGLLVRQWEPRLVHLHSPAAALPMRLLPRRRGPRLAYTVHGYLHMWPPTGPRARVLQRLEQSGSRRTDLTLFQSHEDFDQAQARAYAGNLRFLGNGVEDVWFDLREPRRVGDLRLLFVGRMVEEKGVLDLLDAVDGLDGVCLHLAGAALPSDRDGVDGEVAERLRRPGLSGRVVRHGMVSKQRLLSLYDEVDVICLPSYREGVPRSLIEGMAAARPAITTDVRGCRELVIGGRNGFVVAPGDVPALRTAVCAMAALDSPRFSAMGAAAREAMDVVGRESAVLGRLGAAYDELGVTA